MPIAAAPHYLHGLAAVEASPALRFGLLLPVWNEQTWERDKAAAREAWRTIEELKPDDVKRAAAFLERQAALAAPMLADATMLALHAEAIAPFATGLGNEHPLENGFAFLDPYGLPYLAGSGVKGVVRQAARELAGGRWGSAHGWPGEDERPYAWVCGKERVALSAHEALFGRETKSDDAVQWRGVLTFWDVLPALKRLRVDVMTGHHGEYLMGNGSPHDSESPNPVNFLTVPPGSRFRFHVGCATGRLGAIGATELVGRWRPLVEAAFEHAFEWLGFGAKTAVGYGAMRRDRQGERAAAQRATEARQRAAIEAMPANQQAVEQFAAAMRARFDQLKGRRVKPNGEDHQRAQALARAAAGADWSAEERRAAAEAIEQWTPKVVEVDVKDLRRKLGLAALRGQGG